MKVQRLIEKYKKLEGVWDAEGAELTRQIFIEDLKQLDEPQKVKVPQFVADWIENSKQEKRNLRNALNNGSEKMRLWLLDQENYDLFARAWLDGYEIEEEKRYRVKIKNIYHGDLGHAAPFEQFSFYTKERNRSGIRYEFTRKQLEEAGFGWVFDCEGVEIEEVTE